MLHPKSSASSKLAIYPNLIDKCISDHKTVYIDLKIRKPLAQKSSFTFRSLNKINFTDFNITLLLLSFRILNI